MPWWGFALILVALFLLLVVYCVLRIASDVDDRMEGRL